MFNGKVKMNLSEEGKREFYTNFILELTSLCPSKIYTGDYEECVGLAKRMRDDGTFFVLEDYLSLLDNVASKMKEKKKDENKFIWGGILESMKPTTPYRVHLRP